MMNKIKDFITKNKIHMLVCLVISILLFMSIGFSALQQTLYVSGTAKVDLPEYSIYISSITNSDKENNAYQNADPTFTNTVATTYSTLPNLNSSIVYKVTITNNGKTDAFLDYTVLVSDNNQMKYKIKGINNGDVVKSRSSVDVYIIFEYWDDVSSITNNSIASSIEFQFIPYNPSYTFDCINNWDGSSTSEPLLVDIYGTDYYQINNANEFAWFVNTVNNGSISINAYLTKDICLNSNNLQINDFTGIFDAQNRTIHNLAYSKNVSLKDNYSETIGLFKNNNGIIKNLNLSINFSDELTYNPTAFGGSDVITQQIGGLVANNFGKISNVMVTGQFNAAYKIYTNCSVSRPEFYNYVAGVAAVNSGVVTSSVNKSTFTFNYTSESLRCSYRKMPYLYCGGIVGQNSGYISDSYNNASISSTVTSIGANSHYYGKIGGLVGDVTAGTVKNVYNVGTITHSATIDKASSEVETTSGCVVANNSGVINNAYYLDTCTFTGNGTAVSSNDLTNLNIGIGNYFVKDIYSLNNGFPILGWQ